MNDDDFTHTVSVSCVYYNGQCTHSLLRPAWMSDWLTGWLAGRVLLCVCFQSRQKCVRIFCNNNASQSYPVYRNNSAVEM